MPSEKEERGPVPSKELLGCSWSEDGDGGWESDCGLMWEFNNEGGPLDNDMRYCPKCGKPLMVEPSAESEPME